MQSAPAPRLGTWFARHPFLPLIPLVILAIVLRGIAIFGFAYPTGPDYGLHLLFAQQAITLGHLPAFADYYQLGQATWPLLPGGPLLFGAAAAVSGRSVFEMVPLVLLFAPLEVLGTAWLGHRVLRSSASAIAAAAITAMLPLFVDMMSWAGYPNLIAVSLFPLCLAVWLHYWERPSARWLIVLVLLLCGTAYIHHLSALWLALTLGGFSLAHLFITPRAALRRLVPLAVACAVIGLPILLDALALSTQQDAAAVLTSADRFDTTRATWEAWARIMTPMALLLLAGVPHLWRNRQVSQPARILISVLALLSLAVLFGWAFGLRFYYTRALFFFGIPLAIGGAALLARWRSPGARLALAAIWIAGIGISAAAQAQRASAYFEIVTPDLIEAAAWLEAYSSPGDVVVTGTLLGFQLPRLLPRPQIAALTPDLISNAEVLPLAADATAIMMGLSGMDSALAKHRVRFIVLRTRTPDIPDPDRARRVMEAHPRLRLVFRNADALIYEVR